jgi:hypothetical protein
MKRQCVSKRNRRTLVEENSHAPSSSGLKAALRMLKHGLDLCTLDARKPL